MPPNVYPEADISRDSLMNYKSLVESQKLLDYFPCFIDNVQSSVYTIFIEEKDVVIEKMREEIFWIPSTDTTLDNTFFKKNYGRVGHSSDLKRIIDEETSVIINDIRLFKALKLGKIFVHEIDKESLVNARWRSNLFEFLYSGLFMNRAAIKLANIDASLNFILTNPPSHFNPNVPISKAANKDLLFYFVDICAGPGGFSEYILYRKKWTARGFGFTLKCDENDFDTDKFLAGTPETFEKFYGPDGDGNIYSPANVNHFISCVQTATRSIGVHLCTADGGFDVVGQEAYQEILSSQIYISQCAVALNVLAIGGNFVCKIFDSFTPLSVGLIYLLYHCFEKISILKPIASRPGNSERYIVCIKKQPRAMIVASHLLNLHNQMWRMKMEKGEFTIVELVDFQTLRNDVPFWEYMMKINTWFGKKQLIGLNRIISALIDRRLDEKSRKMEISYRCFDAFKLPYTQRKEFLYSLELEAKKTFEEYFFDMKKPYKNGYTDL